MAVMSRHFCYDSHMKKKEIDAPVIEQEPVMAQEKQIDGSRSDGLRFDHESWQIDHEGHAFYNCVFDHVTLSGSVRSALFVDCSFVHCDFSNASFQEAVMRRCRLSSCRLTGTDFSNGIFQDVLFLDCHLGYGNFSGTKLKWVKYDGCNMKESAFSLASQNHLFFTKCDLSGAEFLQMPLKEIDFSDDVIDGFSVNIECLRGAIMSQEQAAACARLLGIIVR
jgi:uncharacterized protein YjbI with pentapeptide repeats